MTEKVAVSFIPGSGRYAQAHGASNALRVLALVEILVGGSLCILGIGSQTVASVTLALGCVTAVIFFMVGRPYDHAYLTLRDEYESLRTASNATFSEQTDLYNGQKKFIAAFRPSAEVVTGILTTAAEFVKKACDAEVKARYLGFTNEARSNFSADPEEAADKLQSLSENKMFLLKQDIKYAQAAFYRLRDLARTQGYTVYDSWKPYVGIPVKDGQQAAVEARAEQSVIGAENII